MTAPFTNAGTLDVRTGRVILENPFTDSGTMQGAAGALLTLSAPGTFASGSRISADIGSPAAAS